MSYSLKRCPSHNCHQRVRFQRVLSTIWLLQILTIFAKFVDIQCMMSDSTHESLMHISRWCKIFKMMQRREDNPYNPGKKKVKGNVKVFHAHLFYFDSQPWSTPSIHRLLGWMYCIGRRIFGINLRTTFDWESHYTRWWINSIILEMNCKAEYEKYKTIFRGSIENRFRNVVVLDLLFQ